MIPVIQIGRGTWAAQSETDPDRSYVVAYQGDTLTCTCPSSALGHRSDCKHRDAVRHALESAEERKVEAPKIVVDRRFIIDRQGKEFVLYAGLLDAAHQQGLKSIETELVLPGSDVGGTPTWLFKATVVTARGTFVGYGDATAANVSRQMLAVLPRMAETRAKARALRDAVNVGTAALEELGDDEEREQPAKAQMAHNTSTSSPVPPDHATGAQLRMIDSLARGLKIDVAGEILMRFGVRGIQGLTQAQAAEFLDALKAGALH